MVLVVCIATMAVAADNEPASQREELNRCCEGRRLNSFVMQMPVSALRK